MKAYYRGNEIKYIDGFWFFLESGFMVSETFRNMPCGNCGKMAINNEYDACLGLLMGVMNACCGHGSNNEAYVQFLDGNCIHGEDAIIILNILRKHSEGGGER